MSAGMDHGAEAERLLGELREGMLTHSGAPVDVQLAIVHALLDVAEAVRAACEALVANVGEFVDDAGLPSEGGVEVRAGDPDPTPDYPDAGYCGARSPRDGRPCTWQAGHEGAHVAGNSQIAVEVWW